MGTTADTLAAGNEAMTEAAFRTGDYEPAERTYQELLTRARADGDRALEAAVLDRQGMLIAREDRAIFTPGVYRLTITNEGLERTATICLGHLGSN